MTPKQERLLLRQLNVNKIKYPKKIDPLVDRNCVMLDGACDCPRLPGNTYPECKKYENQSTN